MAKDKPSTAVVPIDQKRQAILAEMTPPCQATAKEIEKKRAIVARGSVLANYDVGARMSDVYNNPTKYGEAGPEQIAAYLNLGTPGPTLLNNLATFAETWDRATIVAEMDKPRLDGELLSLKHFTVLMQIADEKARDKLLVRTRQESLTANELEEIVNAQYLKKNIRKGGRKPVVPKTPIAAIHKASQQATQLSNYLTLVDDDVFADLLETKDEEITEQHLARLEELKAALLNVSERSETVQTSVVPVEERIRKVLNREPVKVVEEAPAGKAKTNGSPKPGKKAVKPVPAPEPAPAAKKPGKTVRRRPAPV